MSSSGGGKVRAKRWNREKGKNGGEAVGCGKFEYGIYLPLSPLFSVSFLSFSVSLPLPSIRGDWRVGKDGLWRKDEVCNWCNICGLQDGINVCSLRAHSLVYSSSSFSHFLPPPRPYLAYISIDSENRCFSLITLFLFLCFLSFHLTTFAYISLISLSTLFLCHLRPLLSCLTDSSGSPRRFYIFFHIHYAILVATSNCFFYSSCTCFPHNLW